MEKHRRNDDDYRDQNMLPKAAAPQKSAFARQERARRQREPFLARVKSLGASFNFSLEQVDKTLLILLVLLVLFGLVMVTSTASYNIIRRGQETIQGFMGKQLLLA